MDENTWRLAQMLMWFIGLQTVVMGSILGFILASISSLKKDIKDLDIKVTRIDKDVAVITATLKFNGYDLTRHKAEGE